MKNNLIIMLAVISTSFFVSCDLETDYTPPNYVTFESDELNFAVHESETDTYEVTVYTANVSGNDRSFSIDVDEEESTLDPQAYDLPASVTIPANTNEGTFTVEVTGAGIDNQGDVLVLSLGREQGLFTGEDLTLGVGKVCDFDPAGSFTNNSEWFEAEFPVEIEAGSAPNEYVAKDLFADGSDITFTINEDYTITVPTQEAWVHASYGQASVTGRSGSRIQPCTGTIVLTLQHTVAAGSFGTFSEVLTKGVDTGEDSDGDDSDGDDSDGDDSDGDDSDGDDSDGDDSDGDDSDGDDSDE